MKYTLTARSIYEYGQRVDSEGNPHQEDNIFPAHGTLKDSDRLFILCDGMGGHEAGEVASATVCEAMSQSVAKSAPAADGDFTDAQFLQALADANAALNALPEASSRSDRKMGTTMTFLKLHSKGATIAHIGDSRVYHIRPGKGRDDTQILFQTTDHSLVNELIRMGELTPEQAKHSPQRNVISRAMQAGVDTPAKADIYHTVDIRPGDYFYLCSDGMLEQMEDDNIRFNFSEAMGDIDHKVDILTQATQENKDNHTAILVHILSVEDPLPVEPARAAAAAVKPAPINAIVEDDDSEPVTTSPRAATVTTATQRPATPQAAPSAQTYAKGHAASQPSAKSLRNKGIFVGVLVAIAVLVFLWLFVRQPSQPEPAPTPEPEPIETPSSRNRLEQEPAPAVQQAPAPHRDNKQSAQPQMPAAQPQPDAEQAEEPQTEAAPAAPANPDTEEEIATPTPSNKNKLDNLSNGVRHSDPEPQGQPDTPAPKEDASDNNQLHHL